MKMSIIINYLLKLTRFFSLTVSENPTIEMVTNNYPSIPAIKYIY